MEARRPASPSPGPYIRYLNHGQEDTYMYMYARAQWVLLWCERVYFVMPAAQGKDFSSVSDVYIDWLYYMENVCIAH